MQKETELKVTPTNDSSKPPNLWLLFRVKDEVAATHRHLVVA